MKKFTVGFSTYSGLFSKLIQCVQNTKYSHVYIKFYSDTFETDIIYQASGLAVNLISEDKFKEHNKVIFEKEMELDDESFRKMGRFAIFKCGTPYGIRQIFGIGYVIFMSKFGKKVRNPFPNGSADYVCSELVAEVLKKFKCIEFNKELDSVTPKDVYDIITK